MNKTKVKPRANTKPTSATMNKPHSSSPLRGVHSEGHLSHLQPKPYKRKFTNSHPMLPTPMHVDEDSMPDIDMTRSDSDSVLYPLKKARRDSDEKFHEAGLEYAPLRGQIRRCHSVLAIKPQAKTYASRSEESLTPHSNALNSSEYTYWFSIPKHRQAAVAFFQAIQNSESEIQLKRTYPYISMTADGHDALLMQCDAEGDSDPDSEGFPIDDIVRQIHRDNRAFILEEGDAELLEMDIGSLMELYEVYPLHLFEEEVDVLPRIL